MLLYAIIGAFWNPAKLLRMSRRAKLLASAASIVIATTTLLGCGPSEDQVRATVEQQAAGTMVSNLRATATVARARMQITLDFVGTRVMQAEQSGNFLRANLIALGTEGAFIDADLQRLQLAPSLTPLPTSAAAPGVPVLTIATAPPRSESRPIVTPPATAVVTPDDIPRLEDIVLASGVGRDDCAIDINPVFTPQSEVIYVVARAYNIPSGARLASSWQREGTEVVRHTFQTDFAIHDNCIWFFIDQTDTPFNVGNWAVDIRLDDEPLMPALPFQVVAGT